MPISVSCDHHDTRSPWIPPSQEELMFGSDQDPVRGCHDDAACESVQVAADKPCPHSVFILCLWFLSVVNLKWISSANPATG